MNRYAVTGVIGDGSFGVVSRATLTESGDTVAIKKIKRRFATWAECIDLREIKSLKGLSHPNVIRLREVLREQEELYMVFEFCRENLFDIVKAQAGGFEEKTVRLVAFQVLNGLAYVHRAGFFHRDLKPENLLCNGVEHIKIADFGLAREIRSRPPFTDYVSTRWYRAPEVLLRAQTYNSPVDVWALGVILCELAMGRPLFPATSEIDLLQRICAVLGPPTPQNWPEGAALVTRGKFKVPAAASTPLASLLPPATSPDCAALLAAMLSWDPSRRPTAEVALQHPFLTGAGGAPQSASASPYCAPVSYQGPGARPSSSSGGGAPTGGGMTPVAMSPLGPPPSGGGAASATSTPIPPLQPQKAVPSADPYKAFPFGGI